MSVLSKVTAFLKSILTDINTAISPGVKYLQANVPAAAISIGESVLQGAIAGTPWPALVASVESQASKQGIKLLQHAATVILNTAENNLIAKGTPSAVTTANSSNSTIS